MSKAFVIKENELYSRNKNDFVKHLFAAKIFLSKEDAENYKKDMSDNENCEVVEITIAEGDLEQQLAEKDREIEHLKDCNESLSNKFDKESDMQNEIDILKYNVEDLKQQLTEKDKEIERLKDKLKRTEKAMHEEVKEHLEYYNADQKYLCKQVCDEIRRKITTYRYIEVKTVKGFEWALTDSDINEILDQIEGNANGK